nr:glycogen debranching protein GlgX [Salmonella sp. NCTC 7297]
MGGQATAFHTVVERHYLMKTHVKGFTQLNSAIPEPLRGTFEGMGHKSLRGLH